MLRKCLSRTIVAGLGISYVAVGLPTIATATDLTAGVVMQKMAPGDRYAFITGIIEGLAYARYQSDGKDVAGMKCIYNWFYDDAATAVNFITAAFKQYPDYTPGTIVGVILDKKCPKT